jgi:molybdopterin-guanine dinucleotide biosynthesis protein A
MSKVAALVLAGGSARRLGGLDKPLLDIGGKTMLARILGQIGLPDIAISANGDPARFVPFGRPVLNDGAFVGQGPLAGLLSGLAWAESLDATALLTIPGDTPFVPSALAHRLAPAPACAASNGQVHHLVALWPTSCRQALRDLLATHGRRDVRHFAERIGMRSIDFGTMKWDPYTNINTPEELAAARAMLDEQGQEGAT